MAGYRELLAVEWDDNAVQTFRMNFPDVPVYHGDIAKMSAEECLKLAGVGAGELDVLDGSPPCQGFSTAGKRQMDDPRNSLFREYVRLLRGLRPRAFVMENVSGLVKGKMKLVFADIMRELKASGYNVKCRLLNAMYYNVPQSRQRLIWIGIREDLGKEPSHPKAESRPMSVRDALAGVTVGFYPEIHGKWAEIGKHLPQGETGEYVAGKGHGFGLQRLHWDKPSPTIRKTMAQSSWACLIHPSIARVVSEGEAKRLSAFPDPYSFVGKATEYFARIGNSVPPLFMRAIAGHVKGLLA